MTTSAVTTRPRRLPHGLRALGRESLPTSIEVAGSDYRFVQLFKHDFFAATALYEGDAGKVILKVGRQADILGFPAGWIGRYLAQHEAAAYEALAGQGFVPRFFGRWGSTGIVHEYIEGRPLSQRDFVPDDFFRRLRDALDELHRRGMAYVDLEKRQNVLVGDDGRPYLIDFQIAWHLSPRHGGRTWPARWICRRLQEGDRYHLNKLQRRVRPDLLSPDELHRSYHKPMWVRLHRWITSPFTRVRRSVLNRIDPSRTTGERGSQT